MNLSHCIVLANGVELPRVGLGTFRARGQEVKEAVKAALRGGIKHIDTASIYKNEEDIASALQEANCRREDVFITSKVSPYQQGKDKAAAACSNILRRLSSDYVDLLLIHWPGAAKVDVQSTKNGKLRLETWRVLEGLYKEGRCRAIGVSNFEESHIEELLKEADVPPMVNQVEVHPRFQQRALRAACQRHGIAVVAYASLGAGQLLQHAVVTEVAAACSRTPAQVLLRWGLEEGCAVIPKSVHPERVQQQTAEALLSWELPPAEKARLDGLEDGHKYCWDPRQIA